MFIAPNFNEFQALFIQRLHQMLSPEELGAFILVLANSMQDAKLRQELRHEMDVVFAQLKEATRKNTLQATHDDLLVFEKIIDSDIHALPLWQIEQHGHWALLINPMRSLRPARASSEIVDSIFRRFDESRFHFNKPFLRPEILWEGCWREIELRVLYNKFPFAPYHMLIVPEPEMSLPQCLDKKYHELAWQLVEQQETLLPGFAIGYNSLGACASVNHLHFQGFVDEKSLPIESEQWRHNGGNDAYPMICKRFDSEEDSWEQINIYHQKNQPYNILYRPGHCYLLPRQMQGSEAVNDDVKGAGWIEQCGMFSVPDQATMQALDANRLFDDLKSLSVLD